jgi:hypothetical protein
MPQKLINWFDREQLTLACDGRCDKAWGISNRPKVEFDPDEPDDMAFLADHEVGTAPEDPGTYEGGHGKPSGVPLGDGDGHRMNKWCARECERSSINEKGEPVVISSFAERSFNMPWLHKATP